MPLSSRANNPYIIAEINTTHLGEMELARRAISAAAEAGADAVKFQSWKPDSLYTTGYLSSNRIEARFLQRFAMEKVNLARCQRWAKDDGLDFASTAYTPNEVQDLVDLGADFVKLASMDIDNEELIHEVAASGLPVIISTGMAEMKEISHAVEALTKASKDLVVLHCVSLYPTKPSQVNVSRITALRRALNEVEVGFSDHTEDASAALVALGLGARVFEKHLTLDRQGIGFDNQMAMDLVDFAAYVQAIRSAFVSLGSGALTPSSEELDQALKMRRSAHLVRDVEAGEILREDDYEFKRPGTGLRRHEVKAFHGRKFQVNVPQWSTLTAEQFSE